MSGRLLDVIILLLPFAGGAVGWMARGEVARDKMAAAYRAGVAEGRRRQAAR